jgi:hypothetical protein
LSAIPTHLYPSGPPKCFPSPLRRGCKSSAAALPRRRGEVKGREAGAGRDDRLRHPALHHSPAAAPRCRMEGTDREGKERCVGAPGREARRHAARSPPTIGSPRRSRPRVIVGLLLMLRRTKLFPPPHHLASDEATMDWPLRWKRERVSRPAEEGVARSACYRVGAP